MSVKSFIRYVFLIASLALSVLSQAASDTKPVMVNSTQKFEQTVSSIKAAIKDKGLAIIFEANHKNMIEMVGGQATSL